jgi:hypothetical protein
MDEKKENCREKAKRSRGKQKEKMDENGGRTKEKKQLKRWEIIVNMKTEQNGRKDRKERENRNRRREKRERVEGR